MDQNENLDRHLVELFTLSGEYCINIENADKSEKDEMFRFLSKISPVLYLHGLLFPATEEPDEEGNDRLVTEEQWENVFNTLRNLFGSDDTFYYIDPSDNDKVEPFKGSLAELFADVYQDLKDFAWLVSKNTASSRQHAIFEVKRLFLSNWGAKLLTAQQILHSRFIAYREDSTYEDLFD